MKNSGLLSQKKLKRLLFYSPNSGLFYWKVARGKGKYGGVAGTIVNNRYLQIGINGKKYLAHRLAWLYVYGEWPIKEIDHINRKKTDNRIKNLRELNSSKNKQNITNQKNNSSGVNGVYFSKEYESWIAKIKIKNTSYYLGRYKHFHNAVFARLAGEQCTGWSDINPDSPAKKFAQLFL